MEAPESRKVRNPTAAMGEAGEARTTAVREARHGTGLVRGTRRQRSRPGYRQPWRRQLWYG
ncbi:MAG: hypothetical protein WAN71_05250, partial [Mycobacterium sp.]|uniref:hypothetical protein n=1 Tax=Mycobacterium sp. TaxID=1785 RepID=UPI003BB09A31